jgi:hypothetical protein
MMVARLRLPATYVRSADARRPTCTRAREERADLLAREILEIADAPCKDAVEVQRARNRIDTRKWLASKVAPRKYGDRVERDKGDLTFQPAILIQVGNNERDGAHNEFSEPSLITSVKR